MQAIHFAETAQEAWAIISNHYQLSEWELSFLELLSL
jgi:hypothetical protein